MSIADRIKWLRKVKLNLTQDDFAKSLKISRGNISNIEGDRVNVTDRFISDICKTYNVNEHWLRTGEGGENNVFVQNEDDLIKKIAEKYGFSETECSILEIYLSLPPDSRKAIMGFCQKIAEQYPKSAPTEAQPQKLRTAKMIARSPDSDGKPHLITDEETLSRLESAPESDDDL